MYKGTQLANGKSQYSNCLSSQHILYFPEEYKEAIGGVGKGFKEELTFEWDHEECVGDLWTEDQEKHSEPATGRRQDSKCQERASHFREQ